MTGTSAKPCLLAIAKVRGGADWLDFGLGHVGGLKR